jgi:hypothetical protein
MSEGQIEGRPIYVEALRELLGAKADFPQMFKSLQNLP